MWLTSLTKEMCSFLPIKRPESTLSATSLKLLVTSRPLTLLSCLTLCILCCVKAHLRAVALYTYIAGVCMELRWYLCWQQPLKLHTRRPAHQSCWNIKVYTSCQWLRCSHTCSIRVLGSAAATQDMHDWSFGTTTFGIHAYPNNSTYNLHVQIKFKPCSSAACLSCAA